MPFPWTKISGTPATAVPAPKAASAPQAVPANITRPRLFIGSSREGLEVAEALHAGLDYAFECTTWNQGVFSLSQNTLDDIIGISKKIDFALLVLTPDDLTEKRGKLQSSPRDNVLFEMGLFIGALGRDRTYFVYSRDIELDLPSDLKGITAATYGNRTDGNLVAAVGAACTSIKEAAKKVWET